MALCNRFRVLLRVEQTGGTARRLGVNIFQPKQSRLYLQIGTQLRCAMWTMNQMEFAAWLSLVVVGVALLH